MPKIVFLHNAKLSPHLFQVFLSFIPVLYYCYFSFLIGRGGKKKDNSCKCHILQCRQQVVLHLKWRCSTASNTTCTVIAAHLWGSKSLDSCLFKTTCSLCEVSTKQTCLSHCEKVSSTQCCQCTKTLALVVCFGSVWAALSTALNEIVSLALLGNAPCVWKRRIFV